MELSKTAYVILGLLQMGRRTGYEIKSLVDVSTRFFWAASYGQIYPELRRLEEEGLIAGTSKPQGARPRTVYKLTASGRRALRGWLLAPNTGYELRDEGLLKLFFADALTPEETLALLDTKRELHQATLDQLESQVPAARAARELEGLRPVPMALDYGIRFHSWAVDWCEAMAAELRAEGTPAGAAAEHR